MQHTETLQVEKSVAGYMDILTMWFAILISMKLTREELLAYLTTLIKWSSL
jgi:hypothetical protein